MTLEEIFKTNPSLLDQPEVKALIEYCQSVHQKNLSITKNYKDFYDRVLETVVHNEQMIINGTPDKLTVERILQLTSEF
jgi:hypothetical protein